MPASIVAAALNFFFEAEGLFASSSLPPLASSMGGGGIGAPRADYRRRPREGVMGTALLTRQRRQDESVGVEGQTEVESRPPRRACR